MIYKHEILAENISLIIEKIKGDDFMLVKATPLNPEMGLVYISEETTPDNARISNIQEHRIGSVFFVSFDATLHSFDVMNRNRRQYKRQNIEECLQQEKIQSLLKDRGWYGEADHPRQNFKDQQLSPERIQNIEYERWSHKILNPVFTGNLLQSRIETAAGSRYGDQFAAAIIQGLHPSFSCRAIAQLQMIDGRPTVVVRRVITYDWVLYPSHKEAQAITAPVGNNKSIVMQESADDSVLETGDTMIYLNEILSLVGKTDYNTQVVMESFDLSEEDLRGFNEDHSQIIIADGKSRMYVNLDKKSKHMADDFFASL